MKWKELLVNEYTHTNKNRREFIAPCNTIGQHIAEVN